jgi:hypothetical protein
MEVLADRMPHAGRTGEQAAECRLTAVFAAG